MKHKILISLIIASITMGVAYDEANHTTLTYNSDILRTINREYAEGLDRLQQSIDEYLNIANKWETEKDIITLRQIHLKTRLAFKSIETIIEYIDPAGVKSSINGAPLPKTEQKVADLNILQPKGLQILDELVFSEDPIIEKENIQYLLRQLSIEYTAILRYQKSISLNHRQVFEASRQELIRIFTLGVTGFDTPGSTNALPEALAAIEGIETMISPYQSMINRADANLGMTIKSTFSSAKKYLTSNDDFDSFDRLTFLMDYINPLYKYIGTVHRKLGIETRGEAGLEISAINYDADNIFDEDFLNPQFYSGLISNAYTDDRVALGRRLFYDKSLSKNGSLSCASCHDPSKTFTDGHAKSIANDGTSTLSRNAPTLINAVYAEKYFYDLRESIFEKQMTHVVHNALEFNNDFLDIIDSLETSEEYQLLFDKAYPEQGISKHGITNSLANYVSTLVSFNSPFDQYVRREEESLSDAAKRGFNLFMGKGACGTCHFAPSFNGTVPPLYQESESEVLGVPATTDTIHPTIDPDLGRIANSQPLDEAEFYRHSFKTVTIRNIANTAPYMHNGVYATLEEVVHFYNIGGGAGLGLDVPYQTLPFDSLGLSRQEESDLVAFMQALTDETLSKHDY